VESTVAAATAAAEVGVEEEVLVAGLGLGLGLEDSSLMDTDWAKLGEWDLNFFFVRQYIGQERCHMPAEGEGCGWGVGGG
jgi:hypothetical protein